ncbi:MAG: ATP-binding protein [Pyrinomonadaceae bacterium MAG19_C2-C3]|nr:ATP-binding protein [Pyrinomonadaceae bacterium MAG19_C2-C3]
MTIESNEKHDLDDAPKRARGVTVRRWSLWLLASLVLVLLAALAALQLFVWELVEPQTLIDTTTLFTLSALLFASFIIFAFILLRNLVKLQSERQRHTLGSKLKTRLVTYFISLSLLPITAMAIFSYTFLNRSIEKWFGRLPEDVVTEARIAQENFLTREQIQTVQAALAVGTSIDNLAPEANLDDYTRRLILTGGYEAIELRDANGEIITRATRDIERASEIETALSQVAPDAVARSINSKRAPNIIFQIVRVPLNNNRGTLALVRATEDDAQLNRILASAEDFERLRDKQRRVRVTGLSILGLLTLLVLFATVWTALYLARSLATPIAALAEAATEVTRGNLKHRVTVAASDELAVLANSFNEMTIELEGNRGRIESSAAELQDKNLALEERRNYIETILASLSSGVISLDEDNRVTTINTAASTMLGLSADIIAAVNNRHPVPLQSLVAAQDFATLERVITRARRYGNAIEQANLFLHAPAEEQPAENRFAASSPTTNGNHGEQHDEDNTRNSVPFSLMATALDRQSHRTAHQTAVRPDDDEDAPDASPMRTGTRGVVLVIEDLSELLAAQRAAAWSEVARRLAHEIKNPLTPIQLSAERIQRKFTRAFDAANLHNTTNNATTFDLTASFALVKESVDEGTRTIVREVTTLKAMVDEFSRFARLPSPKLIRTDLNEVITQTVALYAERFAHVRFDARLAPQLPLALLDHEQMRRVFINLFENAIEALAATDDEGRITVATIHDARRNLILAEVIDTGEGIVTENYHHLFQPDFSTRERGTGLGLAIVHRIITDHGGRIRAEPNHPHGARFRIELPLTNQGTGDGGQGTERQVPTTELEPTLTKI